MRAATSSVMQGNSLPLSVHRLRFVLAFETPCRLPRYPGSAIRGLLGHGLRRILCITRQPSCNGCAFALRCGYVRLFESPAAGNRATPHAWVLDMPELPARQREVRRFEFGMSLTGDAAQHLPWLVQALEHAGRLGFGSESTPFSLAAIRREMHAGSGEWQTLNRVTLPRLPLNEVPALPPMPSAILLHLQTPLRLKRDGRLITPRQFSMRLFLNALRLRLRNLIEYHGVGDESIVLPELPPKPEAMLQRQALRWMDWTRYSNRQRTRMKLGGLVGELELDMRGREEWWPLLQAGQWLHMGKQTSMGLGQYRIASLSNAETGDCPATIAMGKAVGNTAREVRDDLPLTPAGETEPA